MLPVFSRKVIGKYAQKAHYVRISRSGSVLDGCVDQVAVFVVCIQNVTNVLEVK